MSVRGAFESMTSTRAVLAALVGAAIVAASMTLSGGLTVGTTVTLGGAGGPTLRSGTGDPDTVVSAARGSLYLRTDTAGLYQNADGATDWGGVGGFAGARVIHGGQTLANSTFAALTFGVEQYDTHGFHDNVTDNTRLTVPAGMGGTYLLVCNITFGSHNGSNRGLAMILNGGAAVWPAGSGTIISDALSNGAAPSSATTLATVYQLDAGDEVQCHGWQNSGGNLATNGGGLASPYHQPHFSITRIGS